MKTKYLKGECLECGGSIEFPKHGIGEVIKCPHCEEITTLKRLPFVRWKNIRSALVILIVLAAGAVVGMRIEFLKTNPQIEDLKNQVSMAQSALEQSQQTSHFYLSLITKNADRAFAGIPSSQDLLEQRKVEAMEKANQIAEQAAFDQRMQRLMTPIDTGPSWYDTFQAQQNQSAQTRALQSQADSAQQQTWAQQQQAEELRLMRQAQEDENFRRRMGWK